MLGHHFEDFAQNHVGGLNLCSLIADLSRGSAAGEKQTLPLYVIPEDDVCAAHTLCVGKTTNAPAAPKRSVAQVRRIVTLLLGAYGAFGLRRLPETKERVAAAVSLAPIRNA